MLNFCLFVALALISVNFSGDDILYISTVYLKALLMVDGLTLNDVLLLGNITFYVDSFPRKYNF